MTRDFVIDRRAAGELLSTLLGACRLLGCRGVGVLACWGACFGVVGPVGACGVGVLGRLMAVAGFFGGGAPVLGF